VVLEARRRRRPQGAGKCESRRCAAIRAGEGAADGRRAAAAAAAARPRRHVRGAPPQSGERLRRIFLDPCPGKPAASN
jgi:hypothetical protein